MKKMRGTTVLCVRHQGKVVMAGDGQITLDQTIMKHTARKVRKIYQDRVLAGFAGATADAFTCSRNSRRSWSSITAICSGVLSN